MSLPGRIRCLPPQASLAHTLRIQAGPRRGSPCPGGSRPRLGWAGVCFAAHPVQPSAWPLSLMTQTHADFTPLSGHLAPRGPPLWLTAPWRVMSGALGSPQGTADWARDSRVPEQPSFSSFLAPWSPAVLPGAAPGLPPRRHSPPPWSWAPGRGWKGVVSTGRAPAALTLCTPHPNPAVDLPGAPCMAVPASGR